MKPELKLSGVDGNAFMLLGVAARTARSSGYYSEAEWTAIEKEATAGDYDHLLQTLMQYFEVV